MRPHISAPDCTYSVHFYTYPFGLFQVAVLLLALVACCHAGILLNSPLVYSAAPVVKNIEIEAPVFTKANLKVITNDEEISTTEVRQERHGKSQVIWLPSYTYNGGFHV